MFDFAETLKEADQALAQEDYALAIFNYWLVNFAYYDEEFPYHYTQEIGDKAKRNFLKLMRKHKDEILQSDSYLKYKNCLQNMMKI